MMKCVEKMDLVAELISNYPTSKQIKMMIARHVQWRFVYITSCLPDSPWTESICNEFEEFLSRIIGTTFNIPPGIRRDPAFHVRLFSCIEDGGMGLLPYSQLRPFLLARTLSSAKPLFEELGFPVPEVVAPTHSLKYTWRQAMQVQASELEVPAEKFFSKSWMECWPCRPLLKLEDDVCQFAVWYRLGLFQPFPYVCLTTGVDLSSFSPQQCLKHVESCCSCGGIFFHIRHENVNNVIQRTFKWHNIPCSLNPKDLPLPDNSKGGPDFVVHCGSDTYCGDVNVTKNNTGREFTRKVRTYESFCEFTSFTVFPFVLSSIGKVDFKSLEILKHIAQKTQSNMLVPDMVANVQFELLRGLTTAARVLKARGALQSGSIALSSPSPSSVTPSPSPPAS
jgi:hypothetical protein